MERLDRIRDILKTIGADGIITYSPENRRYLSGFTGTTGYVIIGKKQAGFITDFRYTEQAAKQCKGYEIIKNENPLIEYLADTIKKYHINNLAFEDDYMTVDFYERLKENINGIKMIPLKESSGEIRIIKDDEELKNIAKAAEIADLAFTHILDYIKPGVAELDIALELEYFMKKNGASGNSFEPIIASGQRSSMPHGVASDKKINNGDLLTMDFGCVYNGYCSDMTRTIVVGKANEEQKKIYDIVLKAQNEALLHIKPGVSGKDVDKVARDIISEAGFGDNFGHGLGHGVGLAIHEEPRLSPLGNRILEKNMVVTDEPGIYIPGFGGVRIEDLVAVGENGPIVFSKSPKELIEL
ncbi:M24 family metallopeptidase [Lutispora thermophila]|uniref:Xaa-Pro aminopeptidase n=1 Tax=Lutispora thermophila DSM 19022 TaxID=1122184 RepID=A0A1M6F4E3_9FIRM|nr:Xaa-Pro peptidase family protein [Lutispora thermophila]SHI92533.1 Xaa-Pro aminopeptidase [Lutispora thermophila DSM 19022]